jgi:UDP:flavonoid glycosyltransferase YjiC (YdhE family)
VVTVGHGRDPAEFEPLPPNVRVVQYVPQTQLIPRCAAVICQGSLNALTAALSHGVPVGSLPVTWGDPLGVNGAERCAELGAGLVLPVGGGGQDAPFDDLRPERIRGMIETLLEQPSYRQAAQRIQAEMHSLPGIADSVPLIEALAG